MLALTSKHIWDGCGCFFLLYRCLIVDHHIDHVLGYNLAAAVVSHSGRVEEARHHPHLCRRPLSDRTCIYHRTCTHHTCPTTSRSDRRRPRASLGCPSHPLADDTPLAVHSSHHHAHHHHHSLCHRLYTCHHSHLDSLLGRRSGHAVVGLVDLCLGMNRWSAGCASQHVHIWRHARICMCCQSGMYHSPSIDNRSAFVRCKGRSKVSFSTLTAVARSTCPFTRGIA